jgi:hypothetical protein
MHHLPVLHLPFLGIDIIGTLTPYLIHFPKSQRTTKVLPMLGGLAIFTLILSLSGCFKSG